MSKRLLSVLKEKKHHPKTRHFSGLPPELNRGIDTRQPLPWPRFIIIDETQNGVYLLRYTTSGEKSGDTWHTNIGDALHQARKEYGDLLGEWEDVPLNVTDVVEYAKSQLKSQSRRD